MADFDTILLIGAFTPSAIYGKYWLSTRYERVNTSISSSR